MGWGMVLGELIGEIVFTGTPMNNELALLDSIADPVESHVDCFGPALFDCFVGNASGTGIVGLVWCGCLWMAHFLECNTEWDTVASVVEHGAEFCLGGRCHDVPHNGADSVNGAVVWWRCGVGVWYCLRVRRSGAEEECTAGVASGFGFGEVRGVAVDVEVHVAGGVADSGVGMGGGIV
jgi:hypothetical protein